MKKRRKRRKRRRRKGCDSSTSCGNSFSSCHPRPCPSRAHRSSHRAFPNEPLHVSPHPRAPCPHQPTRESASCLASLNASVPSCQVNPNASAPCEEASGLCGEVTAPSLRVSENDLSATCRGVRRLSLCPLSFGASRCPSSPSPCGAPSPHVRFASSRTPRASLSSAAPGARDQRILLPHARFLCQARWQNGLRPASSQQQAHAFL